MTSEVKLSPDAGTTTTEAVQAKGCGCKHHDASPSLPLFDAPAAPPCKCKKLRNPRKIHSACALLLLGFLLVHLGICVSGLHPASYQLRVTQLHQVLHAVPGLVAIAVLLPMLVQVATGLFLIRGEGLQYYTGKCDRGGRVRFFLQRWSAVAILFFLAAHVLTLQSLGLHQLYRLTHWQLLSRYADAGLFQAANAFGSTVMGFRFLWAAPPAAHDMNIVVMCLLLVGIWATVFHVANGAWSGAVLWKLLPNPAAKRVWRVACFLLGFLLLGLGSVAWYAFTYAPAALS